MKRLDVITAIETERSKVAGQIVALVFACVVRGSHRDEKANDADNHLQCCDSHTLCDFRYSPVEHARLKQTANVVTDELEYTAAENLAAGRCRDVQA